MRLAHMLSACTPPTHLFLSASVVFSLSAYFLCCFLNVIIVFSCVLHRWCSLSFCICLVNLISTTYYHVGDNVMMNFAAVNWEPRVNVSSGASAKNELRTFNDSNTTDTSCLIDHKEIRLIIMLHEYDTAHEDEWTWEASLTTITSNLQDWT